MSLSNKNRPQNLVPDLCLKRSLSELKEDLFEGKLLGSLQATASGSGDRLVSLTYVQEHHSPGQEFSILTLSLGFNSRDTKQTTYRQDLVIQYKYDHLGQSGGAIRYWFYPDDPALPDLPGFVSSPDFLRTVLWDRPFEEFIPADAEICVQRLLYNANRRVTYLLSSEKTQDFFVLKMVKQEDFDSFFKKAAALRKSPIVSRIILPRLLAPSTRKSLFLYHYIDGIQIKKLEDKKASEIKARLFDEVVQILKTVHQTALSALPVWKPEENENEQLEGMWNALRQHHHAIQKTGAKLIRPLIDHLINSFNRHVFPYSFIIHNSFSKKHILYADEGEKFGVLDWDSAVRGPREKDIGEFLSSFTQQPEACRQFITLYESTTGHAVDQVLVRTFIVYRWLLRLIRKGLKRCDLTEHYLDELKALASQVEVKCAE